MNAKDFRRIARMMQYIIAKILFLMFLITVNQHIISEGFRNGQPVLFRASLESLPHLHWLLKDSDIGDIDVASLAALYLMFVVCGTWRKIAQAYLEAKSLFGINLKKLGTFTLMIGVPMIVADAYVFMTGLLHHSVWGEADFLPCLALTVLYITLLVGSSVELVVLREQIHAYDTSEDKSCTA